MAHDALTAEAERVAQAQQEAETRLQQTESDLARERGRKSDAEAATAELDGQRARLEQERVGEEDRAFAAAEARDTAQAETHAAEGEHDRLTRQIADDEALRDSVGREIAELQERLRRLAARREEIAAQQRQIESELAGLPALVEVEAARDAAPSAFDEARQQGQQAIDAAREAERYESEAARQAVAEAHAERIETERARAAEREAAEASHAAAAESLQKVNARLTKLRAEEAGVAAALKSAANSLWPPLLDALTVEPGFEAALGAAFGDELEASSDRGAPVHWLPLGPLADAPSLPDGATPLGDHVKTLPELARRLAFIGVVADDATGAALQESLKAGQQLVTRDGAVWRWDGYTMRAGAPSTAAVRLSQRNRLAELRQQIDGLAAEHATAQAAVEAEAASLAAGPRCREERPSSRPGRTSARWPTRRGASRRMRARRPAPPNARRRTPSRPPSALPPRRATAIPTWRAAPTSCGRGSAASSRRWPRSWATSPIPRCAAPSARRACRRSPTPRPTGSPRAHFGRASPSCGRRWSRPRATAIAWRARLRCGSSAWARSRRIMPAGATGWPMPTARSSSSMPGASRSRRRSPSSPPSPPRSRPSAWRWAARSTRPSTIARQAADRLAIGETRLGEADKALRQAESELASARESRVRREGLVEQATRDRESVVERIVERLRCEPDGVLALAEVQSLEELPEIEKAEHRLERLVHERETMGAVNLRAEEEANELEQQITGMTAERDDLVAAIARLRQGIQSLNREGRERFVVAFEQVSVHFQQLFTKLFGGGKAELRLTESEDPLEAGLEIHASPPGKKLQVMSLLSGGEQALTALSLLFAVFMTNPAPICVLDEVDAPLDDLNVERFCALVKDIAGRTDTRFMVITHHRVTMARMDRLYGVTMAEQGVSQLVSVNLMEADRLVA